MDYQAAIDYLLSLPDMERKKEGPQARVMSLDTMRRILAALGNPERGRKTIHVTGSKGKGSTSAFITSILHEAGLSTSLYTSPHLHNYTERICLDLKPAHRDDFAKGVTTLKPVLDKIHDSDFGPVSTFGGMTSLFFLLTQWHRAQWQVVEVGMGGTYDGTNVFEQKDVAVITAISLEHTKILGATPAEIAENKAGIITPGCTAVVARQHDPAVLSVIARRCDEVGASLVDVENSYAIKARAGAINSFDLAGPHGTRKLELAMYGKHQLDNAATAVAVAEVLRVRGENISESAIQKGMELLLLPGRFEIVRRDPMTVLDGAHNAESASALAQTMADVLPATRWTIIFGANTDKDVPGILASLKPVCKRVVATSSASDRAMSVTEIAQLCRSLDIEVLESGTVEQALGDLLADGGHHSSNPICVTGSLYLVAEARAAILGENASWSLRAASSASKV